MGKATYKFSFTLSGRKNAPAQSDVSSAPTTQISKAQRILGAEAIDLNINQSGNSRSIGLHSLSIPPPLSANPPMSTLSPPDEMVRDNIPIINRKASSILGISQDLLDDAKSMTGSVYSPSVHSSSRFSARSFENSESTPVSPQSKNQNPYFDKDHRTKQTRSNQFTHVAAYLEPEKTTTTTTISELAGSEVNITQCGQYPSIKFSGSDVSRITPLSYKYSGNRPCSSASCPVDSNNETSTNTQAKMRDTYSADMTSSSRHMFESTQPQSRMKNQNLPNISIDTADNCSWDLASPTDVGSVDLIKKNVLSSTTDGEDEQFDTVPMFLRSSRQSILANQLLSVPSTPVDAPFLDIPEFCDVQLSGPWSESDNERKSFQSLRSRKISLSKSSTSDPSSPNSMLPSPTTLEESREITYRNSNQSSNRNSNRNSNRSSNRNSNRNSSLFRSWNEFLQNNSDSPIFKVPRDSGEKILESKGPSKLFSNDYVEEYESGRRESYIPVGIQVPSEPRLSNCSTLSSTTLGDDDLPKIQQNFPEIHDTSISGIDRLVISSHSSDSNSTSPNTPSTIESYYDEFSDLDDPKRCSSIYPSTALMEVARVGMVIQKASVKEMVSRRPKKVNTLTRVQEVPDTTNHDLSRNNKYYTTKVDEVTC